MKVFLIHAKAGQGHLKAAEALLEEFQKRDTGKSWDIRLIDALDHTRFFFGRSYSFVYLHLVKYAPWLWAVFFRLTDDWVPRPVMETLRTLNNRLMAGPLETMLIRENPDLILVTHFLPSEVASRLKRLGKIHSRVVVVVTDFRVHRFWVNKGADAYVGMMDETRKDLIRLGVEDGRIYELGIPVSSRFLLPVDADKIRENLGLEKNRFTVLVTSGSFGSGPIREFVNQMESLKDRVQAIVVCGINQTLKEELSKLQRPFPCAILGFVSNMHELMTVADIAVSRSSGLTTCESLIKGLPLVIISKIPGQETENAELLKKHGAAFEISNPADFPEFLKGLIEQPRRMKEVMEPVTRLARPHAARDIADFALAGLNP